MDGHEWLKYLKERRPEYSINRTTIIERFANKGDKKSDYVQFGPVYQIFMYAFMLGFHQSERIPLPESPSERKDFRLIEGWKPEGLINYLIMLLISHPPVMKETGIDFVEMEDMEESDVKKKFNHLIKIMEEYANAGFGIIEERFETNPYFFNDSFAFMILLKEVADGRLTANL